MKSTAQNRKKEVQSSSLKKTKTGIDGFDDITFGGLPENRTTLICGAPGCGKTLFAMEFLINGIRKFDEPGVIISFEESPKELRENYSSFGHDIDTYIKQKKLSIDYIQIDKAELEAGEYDLEALFIRIEHSLAQVKAKRIVIDTLEALFAGFDESILRIEIKRLFRWLKEKNVTLVITGEKGEKSLTRYGLEEYVSDCVVYLDHRVSDQLSTRRLRIVKYRGSFHGTNEYPFLIDERGLSVLPITSVGLDYQVGRKRVSTGIGKLDEMFEGKGFYKGSTVLVTGTAGTGKSSIAALFANAACGRGEKCLYFAFEESSSQIIRNMKSIGIDFEKWVKKDRIKFQTVRPTLYGLELHLVTIHKLIQEYKPDVVVLDPISNLISQGNTSEVKGMLLRIIDFLKLKDVTTLMTNLTSKNSEFEHIEVNVSSIADTWINLRDIETNGELKRGMFVVKSRGMPHSNKIREFNITDNGISLASP